MNQNLKNISLNENSQPTDFSRYITQLFVTTFRGCFDPKEVGEFEVLLFDIESQDFDNLQKKINSGSFLTENQFAYTILKTFSYTFDFSSIDRESKINKYLDQLNQLISVEREMGALELISLVYLSLLNSTMQVMYAISYVIIDKEYQREQEEVRLAKALDQSNGASSAAQLLGGLTYISAESQKLKNIGLASVAYGFYSEYSDKRKKRNSFQSELNSIMIDLNKSYTDLLSHLVSGSQIATKLFSANIEDEKLYDLTSKAIKKWNICCRYCLTTNEFKGFLAEHMLVIPNDKKLRQLILSNFKYIQESTDLNEEDFKVFPQRYDETKKVIYKIKSMPWLMLIAALASILTLSNNFIVGLFMLSLIFVFIMGYFKFQKEYDSVWLAISSEYDELINNKEFLKT